MIPFPGTSPRSFNALRRDTHLRGIKLNNHIANNAGASLNMDIEAGDEGDKGNKTKPKIVDMIMMVMVNWYQSRLLAHLYLYTPRNTTLTD